MGPSCYSFQMSEISTTLDLKGLYFHRSNLTQYPFDAYNNQKLEKTTKHESLK